MLHHQKVKLLLGNLNVTFEIMQPFFYKSIPDAAFYFNVFENVILTQLCIFLLNCLDDSCVLLVPQQI
jgi:hypothetical protein